MEIIKKLGNCLCCHILMTCRNIYRTRRICRSKIFSKNFSFHLFFFHFTLLIISFIEKNREWKMKIKKYEIGLFVFVNMINRQQCEMVVCRCSNLRSNHQYIRMGEKVNFLVFYFPWYPNNVYFFHFFVNGSFFKNFITLLRTSVHASVNFFITFVSFREIEYGSWILNITKTFQN